MAFDFNITNFSIQPFYYAFQPYIHLLGDIFWGILAGFIGGGIYVNSERQYLHVMTYIVIVVFIFGILLQGIPALLAILSLILTLIASVVFYKVYVETRVR